MFLTEVKFKEYISEPEEEVERFNEYAITLDDARRWWGQSLPTEKTEDGYDLLTEWSVFTSLLANLNLIKVEVEIAPTPFELFHDFAFLIETMLGEDGLGSLEFVATRGGQEGELAPGYRHIPPADPDDPFNFSL